MPLLLDPLPCSQMDPHFSCSKSFLALQLIHCRSCLHAFSHTLGLACFLVLITFHSELPIGCHACWSRYGDWPPRNLSKLLVLCLPLLKNRKANSYIPQSPFQIGFWIWSLFCQLEKFACVFKGRIESEASFFFCGVGVGNIWVLLS